MAWTASPSGTTEALLAVTGSGPNDVWAAGENSTVLHWSGAVWIPAAQGIAPGSAALNALYEASPNDLWAAGVGGRMWRWRGIRWEAVEAAAATESLNALWGSSAEDVWAVGGNGGSFHYDGTSWTAVRTGITKALFGLWGSGGGTCGRLATAVPSCTGTGPPGSTSPAAPMYC